MLITISLTACGQADDADSGDPNSTKPSYVVMGDDLQELKDDFNASKGRVRLVFLSGPTCGICLRGMADLNDEFLAASQNDDRLVTFVVHVPTMGAEEHHAADSIPLLDGPRVHHYWEESGIIGQHYTEVMDVDIYVWDFWAIYGPDAIWEGTLPPVPDYYEHQLGVSSGRYRSFPKERVLNAERFAAETRKHLDEVDSQRFASPETLDQNESERLADGTVIPAVGQPRNVAVSQHIRGRGGFSNLKRIQSIQAHGTIEVAGQSYALTVHSERPNVLRRTVKPEINPGLPSNLEQKLLDNFEFDGLLVEWPKKDHELSMVGMLKIGSVLAWKLDLKQKDGDNWSLYIDSHTGGLVRADMLDADEQTAFSIHQSDFRETAGFTFPHRIEYMDKDGRSLAVETIDEITLDVTPFELEQNAATH